MDNQTPTDESSSNTTGQERPRQDITGLNGRPAASAKVTDINGFAESKGLKLRETDAPDITYDAAELADFLTTVFWRDLEHNENILVFRDFYIDNADDDAATVHGFPISEETLFKQLSRSTRPASLYYGTATTKPCPTDDRLFNRKELFINWNVLVLDDIGTKIPHDILPTDIEPSYIVESSEGNFQYGYVLAEPVTKYAEAKVIIKLFADNGYTDAGGLLPTKKVRLPQGVHGKKNSADPYFQTRLVSLTDARYTIDDLLTSFAINRTWEEIQADPLAAEQRIRTGCAAVFAPINPQLDTINGIVDPALESLAYNNLLLDASGPFYSIICPWCDEHSTGENVAGYSPLGIGSTPQQRATRAFHCFHESCATNKTPQFLSWVEHKWGLVLPIFDPAAELVSRFVFDSANNCVHDISKEMPPPPYKMPSFSESFNQRVKIDQVDKKGVELKPKYLTMAQLWSVNPARVIAHGTTFDPSTPAKIIRRGDTTLVNTFAMPNYGDGAWDKEEVDFFLEYINYLIPDKEDSDTFIQILAAKMQNPSFRGWGLLMIAKQQRTGRGTLEAMITELFHPQHCFNVPLNVLTSDGNYNEWQGGLWAFTSEAEGGLDNGSFYRVYNILKDRIDTTKKNISINHKYGIKEHRGCFTTHLLFSNYTLGAALEAGDKRFFVINNVEIPRGPEYFSKVHAWIERLGKDARPVWCKHVARYLRAQKVDWAFLNGPAPTTKTKETLIEATRSAIDVAIDAFIQELPSPFFTYSQAYSVLYYDPKVSARLNLSDNAKKYIRHKIKEISVTLHVPRIRVGTRNAPKETVLALSKKIASKAVRRFQDGDATEAHMEELRAMLKSTDVTAITTEVDATLAAHGF